MCISFSIKKNERSSKWNFYCSISLRQLLRISDLRTTDKLYIISTFQVNFLKNLPFQRTQLSQTSNKFQIHKIYNFQSIYQTTLPLIIYRPCHSTPCNPLSLQYPIILESISHALPRRRILSRSPSILPNARYGKLAWSSL